jgi:hypothetical protein
LEVGGRSEDVARHPDVASAPGVGGVVLDASAGDAAVLLADRLFRQLLRLLRRLEEVLGLSPPEARPVCSANLVVISAALVESDMVIMPWLARKGHPIFQWKSSLE